tara:strand:- start:347 stop:991 length:645 start_codon:yes stop_codon:yes gene_type:complete
MKQFIEHLEKKHHSEFHLLSDEMEIIYPKLQLTHKTETTSKPDCKFLQLVCLEFKPKKIIEIGTWIGSSAYSMASATKETGAVIYTCDNKDEFVDTECVLSNRIKTFPGTWSTKFLENNENLKNTDFIFNDAHINTIDCSHIYDRANNSFIFTTHDYFNSTGNFDKGYIAIQSMIHILKKKNAFYDLYLPDEEWYYAGHMGINACTALLICKKA